MAKETSIYDPISRQHIPVIADVIVIGGGIAGLSAVRKLAEAGKTSAIFDQRKAFMLGASGINPGRMGLGFHYADPPTAFTYLKATIDFVRKYKKEGHDFRLGADRFSEDDAMRRGRYFIPQKSLVPAEKLLEVYRGIREEYRRLVEENPENQVFGSPDTFYRVLPFKEYKDDLNLDQDIALAIETREQLLDVPSFRDYLIRQVESDSAIQAFKEAKVTHIERTPDTEYYIITVEHEGQIKKIAAPQLINASWESTDKLNQTLGVLMDAPGYALLLISEDIDKPISNIELTELSRKNESAPIVIKNSEGAIRIFGNTNGSEWKITTLHNMPFEHVKFPKIGEQTLLKKGSVPVYIREEIAANKSHMASAFRTNRIKVLAEVELPDSLKDKPCMFFAIGPFCMFSNMQNGRGLMTYALETNYIQSKELALTPEEEAKLHQGFTPEETQTIGQKIIDGVAEFIPAMKDAKLVGIRGGVVKTYGDVDLCDPNSDFHKRRELGIQEMTIDALEISSMKLLYGEENAEQAVQLLALFEKTKEEIGLIAEELALHYTGQTSDFECHAEFATEETEGGYSTPLMNEFLGDVSQMLKKRGLVQGTEESAIVNEFHQIFLALVKACVEEKKSVATKPPVPKILSPAVSIKITERQNPAAAKILAHHFSVYLKRYSTTKDINKDTLKNKEGLLPEMKATITRKIDVADEVNQISLSQEKQEDHCLVPSKVKAFAMQA